MHIQKAANTSSGEALRTKNNNNNHKSKQYINVGLGLQAHVRKKKGTVAVAVVVGGVLSSVYTITLPAQYHSRSCSSIHSSRYVDVFSTVVSLSTTTPSLVGAYVVLQYAASAAQPPAAQADKRTGGDK